MFCRKCGNKLNDDAKFCPKCGTEVKKTSYQSDGVDNEDGQKDENNNQYPDKNGIDKKITRKRRNKKAVPIVLFLFCAGIIGYLFVSSRYHMGLWRPAISNDEGEVGITGEGSNNTVYELNTENVVKDSDTGVSYVNNIIIISFKDETPINEVEKIAYELGGEVVGGFPSIYRYQIQVEESSLAELDALCKKVETYQFVKDAHVDLANKYSVDEIPEDPWKHSGILGEKWSEEKPNGSNWWQEAINAPSAWEYNSYYDNINIGIIDNGFDLEHEDLTGVIKSVTEENNVQDHGTHVAGIIGAKDNNNIGITGVVWDASIFASDCARPETVINEDGVEEEKEVFLSDEEMFHQIIDLIQCHNCRVINLSAGKSLHLDDFSDEYVNREGIASSTMIRDLRDQGYDFIIVQSAGNGNLSEENGKKKVTPVDSIYNGLFCSIRADNCVSSDKVSAEDVMKHVMVVGAAQNDGNCKYSCCGFSNYGDHVDIWAPGEDIYSTVPGGYDEMDGTSMAAPIVTGVTALVWGMDTSLTGAQVKDIVCNNDCKKHIVYGDMNRDIYTLDNYGMINAQLAVEKALEKKLEKGDEEISSNPIASKKEREAKSLEFKGVVITPEDVVLKMFGALKKGEYDKAAECLDPTTEQTINFFGGIVADVINFFTGEGMSWGQMLLEAAGATDVEIIECKSYNLEVQNNMDLFSDIFDVIPEIKKLIYSDADVYVKYRYKYNGKYYINQDKYHVKRYGWTGWRIVADSMD